MLIGFPKCLDTYQSVSVLVVSDSERATYREADQKGRIKRRRVLFVGTLAFRGGATFGTWVSWGAQVPHRVVWDARRSI
ncbi:hypothetical protein L195_g012457 [Trifolium pratense]|uniref:Uncharacterized protein n=1 Tax=Trifolium pratense TaxID=57577 RepID=A0A2K3PKG0_TRIPR|nr:hypothetical protein L195_g012457 [Trifolium pratense]